ncbi:MAG: protein kinase [Polyangiaceae bacterium]|nr:protein kinase [Polyangiaceae bacterium]
MAVDAEPRQIGRYQLFEEIACGGMAKVHLGRLVGPVGFSRTVAIKRLHPAYARDPEFVTMFLDEARLAARIRHPNVVPTLDVVATHNELFLVMEYVQGESLGQLLKVASSGAGRLPPRVALGIVAGALQGLHAAHEARDERGFSLGLVHRDVSPQNILVGVDGTARVLDFGVAKAAGRAHTTRDGVVKGKLAYMAPEQLQQGAVTRRADIYAAAIVLWEALAGRRLFQADTEGGVLAAVLTGAIPPLRDHVPDLPAGVEAIVARGLSRSADERFETARDMALALERCGVASSGEVAVWLETTASATLAQRAAKLTAAESYIVDDSRPPLAAGVVEAESTGSEDPAPPLSADARRSTGSRRRAAVVAGVAAAVTLGWFGFGSIRSSAVEQPAKLDAAPAAQTEPTTTIAPNVVGASPPPIEPSARAVEQTSASAAVAPSARAAPSVRPVTRAPLPPPTAGKRSRYDLGERD